MTARGKLITLFAALSFLAGWTANPQPCSAHGYCYQAPPVQVYNYPNYYGYTSPAPVPSAYYVASTAPPPCIYKKHQHKHKHKHRYCQYY